MLDNLEVEMEFSIKSYNIDAAGHVNNAVYINWLEDLRSDLLEKVLPHEVLMDNNLHLVVASTNIEYKKPLHLYEKPKGRMKIDKYGRGVFYLSCLITLNNKKIARASQKCVLIDKLSHKMVKETFDLK